MAKKTASSPITINGHDIPVGRRTVLDLTLTKLYTQADIRLPVHVIRGRKPGPKLFVSAAIHGDEINGVEIVRRLLKMQLVKGLRGVLIAVPVVNIHGFIHQSRYLPDRRDLNRSFPGSSEGSLTGRMAKFFVDHIVKNATHGIDLHTGAIHRENLPQIRANLKDPETRRLADAFGVPVLLDSELRDGSLRAYASECGVPMLLYEAGEALRFDELSIRAGIRGIIQVMRALEMLPPAKEIKKQKGSVSPFVANTSYWVRAPESGVLRVKVPLGGQVKPGDRLGTISNPFGEQEIGVFSKKAGVVIGKTNLPLVNEGEALFHIACFSKPGDVAQQLDAFADLHELNEPLLPPLEVKGEVAPST